LPGSDRVKHGVGEHWYYGTGGNEEEKIWRNDYQNYISNFIRHGDPNGKVQYNTSLKKFRSNQISENQISENQISENHKKRKN